MTSQDTTLELINAEIDGVLTGPQRAELNRLLLADPSVRALRDGLTRTCRTLDEMPRAEIPAGLHEAIVTGWPVAAPKSHGYRRAAFTGRPLLRYAAALAAACWSVRWPSSSANSTQRSSAPGSLLARSPMPRMPRRE
ncbi:MAG: hypothetical protein IPF50_17270 [Proteobacteria bacterium]|nr:hypothetical protein [Pseudomonadota bacterium]